MQNMFDLVNAIVFSNLFNIIHHLVKCYGGQIN
jgi:hypothetical protein